MKKILVANRHLDKLGGTETYTYTIIQELKRLGFKVEYYTLKKGGVSEKIEKELEVYFMTSRRFDLILANHDDCIQKIFHRGFLVQTCHGIFSALETPSKYADAYVSISEEVMLHLKSSGFNSKIIRNGINLERFSQTKALNKKVKKILSLSQNNHINQILKSICAERNIIFSSINKFKHQIWNTEDYYNDSDLVFGLGRSAFEAMACGRPVIIYDHRPYSVELGDGYVKKLDFLTFLENNFSGRYRNMKFSKAQIHEEINNYDYRDGMDLKYLVSQHLDIGKNIKDYLSFTKQADENSKIRLLEKQARRIKLELYKLRKKLVII